MKRILKWLAIWTLILLLLSDIRVGGQLVWRGGMSRFGDLLHALHGGEDHGERQRER